MKKLLLALLLATTTLGAWAAKAHSEPVTITQKDGTQLTIRLYGNAEFHYNMTIDGVLLYQHGTDYYIARINDNGELENTNVLAHQAGQRTAEEQALIKQQDRKAFFTEADKQLRRTIYKEPVANDMTLFPHTGSPRALVLLADFADQKFKHDNDAITLEIFDQYLNAEGTPAHPDDASLQQNHASVRQYFTDMSGGLFTPIFDVKAVVHLSQNMESYGKGKSDNMNLFIPEVCRLADDAGVDFSEYDANGDGYVDLVYIIYAGYGQNYSGNPDYTIWPKSGGANFGTYDGKTVFRFGVHNEINFNPALTNEKFAGVPQINGIGLFCHEFSHCMGLPDFYPTTTSAQNAGNPAMEYWDLMDGGEYTNNGYQPTAYTAWEREAMGWITIETLTDDMKGPVYLENIDKEGGKAYRIYPDGKDSGNEYIIIQNIQPYNWNTRLGNNFGHGMLITHVDYDSSAFSLSRNSVNNAIGHSRMTIIPADDEYISSYLVGGLGSSYTQEQYRESHKGDPYPGTNEVTEIESFPVYEGTMNKPFYRIKEENGIITFDFLEETVDAIEQITHETESRNDAIYTLDGRRLNQSKESLPKGIYIIGKKKVAIK